MQRNKNKTDTLLLVDILREVFKHEGIEFKSFTFLRVRVIDDRIILRPILSVTDLLRELIDGDYQLTLGEVTIHRIEKEPFTVPEITVTIFYENNQWSEPRIYTPEYETFGPEHNTPQALQARFEEIVKKIKIVLHFITLVADVAKTVRAFFE